jgi:hypothetical protein
MKKSIMIFRNKREFETIEVFFEIDPISVTTRPYNMNLEDSLVEMLEDIQEFNIEYLQELILNSQSINTIGNRIRSIMITDTSISGSCVGDI